MEATCSSEMSVDFQRTTERYIPEDMTLPNHRYENFNSYKDFALRHQVRTSSRAYTAYCLVIRRVKRSKREADHSLPSNAEISAFIPTYVFMTG
jgi:hypothetical protein